MKVPSLSIAIAAVLACPAIALTTADITPAALIDKTITFTATNGTGLLPASGTWTGKCESSPAGRFTIANTGGGIVQNHVTTFTAVLASGTTALNLGSAYSNSGTTSLALSIAGDKGVYALSCVRVEMNGGTPVVTTATQGGTFTLGAPAVSTPEIAITQGATNLTDGAAQTNFGKVKPGKKSAAKTYKITNSGKANLTGLKITASGKNKADFIITKPAAATLAQGASTTFTISFKPAKTGKKSAAIQIASNDADENPFDIKLTGTGKK